MYIEQAYKGFYENWRYILGCMIIFSAWQLVGMIPLLGAIGIKVFLQNLDGYPSDISKIIDLLGNNLFLFLMLLSFGIGLLGLFFTVKILHKQSLLSLTTTRSKIDWSRFLFSFIIWGLASSSFVLVDWYFNPEHFQFNFQLKPFLVLALIAIVLIPIQTSFEEYLFRGYLMQGLGTIFNNKWMPLILTSVGFGLLHIFNPEVQKLGPVIMVFYIGTGFFLGILTLMDEGLELALGFHAANNLFTALLVTADWTAFQTHSILKDLSDPTDMAWAEIFFPVFVVYPLLLFACSRKYKWTHWKDKLLGSVEEPTNNNF